MLTRDNDNNNNSISINNNNDADDNHAQHLCCVTIKSSHFRRIWNNLLRKYWLQKNDDDYKYNAAQRNYKDVKDGVWCAAVAAIGHDGVGKDLALKSLVVIGVIESVFVRHEIKQFARNEWL